MAAYDAALRIRPGYAAAHSNRGNALKEAGRLQEALASYEAALRLKPDFAEAHANRGNTLTALGRLDEALASYETALGFKPDHAEAHSNYLLALHYREADAGAILPAARRFGRLFAPASAVVAPRLGGRRLRIGYVSGDFRRHSVSYFFEPLLRHHDRERFELFAYSNNVGDDDTTRRLMAGFDHWRRIRGVGDETVADGIRADGIDILVDLAGHTAHNRLPVFARRPAPVQVSWLGYPGTTGLAAIDYRLVDAVTDPEGEADALATETLIRLSPGFLCYGPPADAPLPASRPAGGGVTFGSFNNPAKLSPEAVALWAEILHRLPEARLLLKGRPFADGLARGIMEGRFAGHGIAAGRLELTGWLPGDGDHMATYGRVDVALDPFPYNGTTTTCEALWMGVPVVTLAGSRHAGRVGASLLHRLGLDDLVAGDPAAYIGIALGLAGRRDRLAELRQTLRPRLAASSLGDAAGFARAVECAFHEMWERSGEGT